MAGDPILSTVCKPVLSNENVAHIVRDMMDILANNKNGVGLSANQAGHAKRIIIIKSKSEYSTFINPIITRSSLEKNERREWCLSYPNQSAIIKRSNVITLTTLHAGENDKTVYSGFKARIIQHEIDHLDGICKVIK
jgi:peptide deformylase